MPPAGLQSTVQGERAPRNHSTLAVVLEKQMRPADRVPSEPSHCALKYEILLMDMI